MSLRLADIRMRDPFLIEPEPGSFLLFGTTDENLWGGPATGFDCYASTDLESWDGPVSAFRPPAGFWADTQFWAPEVRAYAGRFYLFATFASSATQVRGVAVLSADSPAGPYTPWSDGPVTPVEIPCLDGTLFVDDDGQPWLVYSRGAEGARGGPPGLADGEMYARRLSADLRTPVGEPELLFRASSADWSKPLWFPPGVEAPEALNLAKDPLFTDGAFLVRAPSGALFMLWSSFGEEGYAMGVARSVGGDVRGPWMQSSDPLWPLNGGHGMILTTSAGATHLVFHWPNDSPNERVKLVDVAVTDDGISLVTPAAAPRFIDENTPLAEVLASDAALEVLAQRLPHLAGSVDDFPINISTFPISSVLRFELADDEGAVHDLLDRLGAIENPIVARIEAPVIRADPDYEDASVPRGSASVSVSDEPAQYRTVELVLTGPDHGNPFVDVQMTARFSTPEAEFDVGGFYDGDGRYLIRFLPPVPGQWSFQTVSTARSLDGIEGSFTVSPTSDAGPVRVVDRSHFETADGVAFAAIGTTAYAWIHQADELQERTLTALADAPFTKLRMCLFPKDYVFNHNEPDDFVFSRAPGGTFDHTRFDLGFFARLERRIAQLAARGVHAELILFHPYDRWGFADMGAAVDDRYLTYVVRRLAAFPTVWWSLANEYDLLAGKRDADWNRLGELVAAEDHVGHPRSIHNIDRQFDHSQEWVTHVSTQKNTYEVGELIDRLRDEYDKPVSLDEFGYDGDLEQEWGNLTAEEVVRRAWQITLRGGYFTHGETLLNDEEIIFWAHGGDLRGESPARIAFLRDLVAQTSAGRLSRLRDVVDVLSGGVPGEVAFHYLDANRPAYRTVQIPEGSTALIDVIDTWNMTVEELSGVQTGTVRIDLPGRPYMALRVRWQ